MIRRIVVYGFPVVFVVLEFLVRGVLQTEQSFIAPTLASAGIGQLFPLVALKNRSALLSAKTRAEMKSKGFDQPSSKADRIVTGLAWNAIFLLTIVWAILLYFSIKSPSGPEIQLFGSKTKTWSIGLVTYFVGVVLAEIKEWV